MKDVIFIVVVAAVIWSAWMHVCVNYLPEKEAKNYVEEIRLLIDGSIFKKKFHYQSPLPEVDFDLPKNGISTAFRVERMSGPGITDSMDSRVVIYSVRFEPSEAAKGPPRREVEYRMIQVDEGSYLFPSWKVTRFIGRDRYERELKARERRGAAFLPVEIESADLSPAGAHV